MTTFGESALNCAIQLGRANADGTAILDLETQIKAEIIQAMRTYNREPWHLTETRLVTLNTVAGQDWYDTVSTTQATGSWLSAETGESAGSSGLSSVTTVFAIGDDNAAGQVDVSVEDILHIEYMRENATSLTDGLRLVRYDYFERLQEGSTIGGPPTAYTRYAGQIGIYPTPSQAWELTFSANMKPPFPVNDDDENIWLTQANELIESAACARVCQKYLRDPQRAQEFAQMAQIAKDTLHAEYIRKSKTGRVKVHC